jgi:hypothetical protein
LAFTAAKPTRPVSGGSEEPDELATDELATEERELDDEAGVLELERELATLEAVELLLAAAGREHSFTPPPVRPPKVASLQAKLPLKTL